MLISCSEGSDGEGEAGRGEEEEDDESGCMTNRSVLPLMLCQYKVTLGEGPWGGGGGAVQTTKE